MDKKERKHHPGSWFNDVQPVSFSGDFDVSIGNIPLCFLEDHLHCWSFEFSIQSGRQDRNIGEIMSAEIITMAYIMFLSW